MKGVAVLRRNIRFAGLSSLQRATKGGQKGSARPTWEEAFVTSNGDYAKALGERLRRIRIQKGMSLHDVQEASKGRWKAAVVGAYERGDRNVTVPRLSELAGFYGVPVSELIPDGQSTSPHSNERRRVVLNLEGLDRIPESDRDPLARFTAAIQVQRGDFNGRVLTIRQDDLMSLALLYQTTADDLARQLDEWGLLAAS